jgi:hypothetical protein
MPALWQHYTDHELGAVMDAFRASRTPEEGLADMRRMLPYLPPATRAAMLRATLAAVPADQADQILDTTSTTLG